MIKFNIVPLLWVCGLVGSVVVALIWFFVWLFSDNDTIKVKHPIQPFIEITIKDNEIDTLYVYRKP